MQFQVNKGQRIPHRPEGHSGAQQFLEEGAIVEGPTWWAKEFEGRMTPLDANGKPVELRRLVDITEDVATLRAHERVGYLRQLIEERAELEPMLKAELEKAEQEADRVQKEVAERRQKRAGDAQGHDHGDSGGLAVRQADIASDGKQKAETKAADTKAADKRSK